MSLRNEHSKVQRGKWEADMSKSKGDTENIMQLHTLALAHKQTDMHRFLRIKWYRQTDERALPVRLTFLYPFLLLHSLSLSISIFLYAHLATSIRSSLSQQS